MIEHREGIGDRQWGLPVRGAPIVLNDPHSALAVVSRRFEIEAISLGPLSTIPETRENLII